MEKNEELDHPDKLKEIEANNSRIMNRSRDSFGDNQSRGSAFNQRRRISKLAITSMGDQSCIETMSQPGTTSSLENYFERMNAITDNQVGRESLDDGMRRYERS